MKVINPYQKSKIDALVKESVRYYMKFKNVTGMGTSYKMKNGIFTGELCITFGVSKKEDIKSLSINDMLPDKIDDILCDVVEKPKVYALANTGKKRPCYRGFSIGHYSGATGTFGCICGSGPNRLILSNNHVMANENKAKLGDPIYQPGGADGGGPADTVAYLYKFAPIYDYCTVDAAVAVEKEPGLISGFNSPSGAGVIQYADYTKSAYSHQRIVYNGRTSGDNKYAGEVWSSNYTVLVHYSMGPILIADSVEVFGYGVASGDSGSVNDTGAALLFAGDPVYFSYWNNMINVMSSLGITIGDTGGSMLVANKQKSTSRFDR